MSVCYTQTQLTTLIVCARWRRGIAAWMTVEPPASTTLKCFTCACIIPRKQGRVTKNTHGLGPEAANKTTFPTDPRWTIAYSPRKQGLAPPIGRRGWVGWRSWGRQPVSCRVWMHGWDCGLGLVAKISAVCAD
jgi:hypothetical protein